jgi:hypothetical protein
MSFTSYKGGTAVIVCSALKERHCVLQGLVGAGVDFSAFALRAGAQEHTRAALTAAMAAMADFASSTPSMLVNVLTRLKALQRQV